jgi:hypothetical protein
MATEGREPGQERTIEMRLAAIEEKLSQLHITEEEMRAYQKVSGLLGGQTVGSQMTGGQGIELSPQICQISRVRGITPRGIIPRSIVRSILPNVECNECGPCAQGGGFFGGGGFGAFGM